MANYHLPHIAITVSNINITKDFYSKLGFLVKEDFYSKEKKRHFLLLEGYGLEIEIFNFDRQISNQRFQANLQIVGFQHIALPVKNLEEKKKELLTRGIDLFKDINISSLKVKNLNIIDPSGIIIEFFELNYE